jgi:hypothetical protein
MKNFKDLLSEVAQPKSPEERAFKDQHKIELIKHPVAPEHIHTGEIPGVTKKERPADPKAGEDEKKYDNGAAAKAKPFKMPRNIDESDSVKAKEELTFKGLMTKVSESADLLESPQEEVSMMMKQLNFICYASEEIQEYLEIDGLDPEEWWQGKLAQAFGEMKSLYAYAKGSEVTNKAIDMDGDDDIDDDDVELEAGYIASGMYEEVEGLGLISESFDLSESKIDIDFIGSDSQKASMEKKYNVKISMHGDGMAYVNGEPKDVFKFAIDHYGDADDAADNHPGLAKSIRYHKDGLEENLEEANFKAGNIRLKNGQNVKIDFKDVKHLNSMMKGLNPKNRKEMETNMMKDKKGFDEILKFATQSGA